MIHSSTIVSRSPSAILSHIARLKAQYDSRSHSLLFALSCPSSPRDLSSLVDNLTAFLPSSTGCLSAPLAPGVASCSLAIVESEKATFFRSTIPGRPKTQVGRWHAFRKKEEKSEDVNDQPWSGEEVDWRELWRTKDQSELPSDLAHLDAGLVDSILYLSDHSPEGLSSALSTSFPKANKLGLLASSTPFITGRPVTLFHNGSILDAGAVGVALKLSKQKASCYFDLPGGIEPLGAPMNITDSEGNLINTLNHANPTKLLLSSIHAAGIDTTSAKMTFKEDTEFYLGVLSDVGSVRQLHSVTAGDPSRGTISLNTQTTAPAVGSRVQFYRRHSPPSSPFGVWSKKLPPRTLAFTTSAQMEDYLDADGGERAEDFRVLDDTFLVASENGFILSRAGEVETPWACTVPGCLARVQY